MASTCTFILPRDSSRSCDNGDSNNREDECERVGQ